MHQYLIITVIKNEVCGYKYKNIVNTIWWISSFEKFGSQEPGTEKEIKEFVAKYNVTFDLFSKIDVNFSSAHPLWVFLKNKQG